MTIEDIKASYTPIIHEENGRFWAEIPAMPGCFSEGDTLEEVKKNVIEAAQGWIEAKLDWLMGHIAPTSQNSSPEIAFA